jgi:threonine/homoserine/homoserine lactone efflux protein
MELFVKGLIIGFSIAAPVGPIGILCIKNTIKKNYASGFFTGMGAATADMLYALIAALGLTTISDLLLDYKLWIQITGILFLGYLGIKSFIRSHDTVEKHKSKAGSIIYDFVSTLFLTITNPITILSFLSIFTGVGLIADAISFDDSKNIIAGVFFGSTTWWLILTTISHFIKGKISNSFIKYIDYLSGAILLGFAVYLTINTYCNK